MSKVWLDDETFSPVPITNGTHRYAEGAEVMIRALALDDGAVQIRDLTPGGRYWTLIDGDIEPSRCGLTDDLNAALEDDPTEVWAHNSHFDRTVERHAGLQIPLHRWRDTMVQAMCHGLPGGLGALADIVLKLPADKQKDKEGKALIRLFCMPQKFRFPYPRNAFDSKKHYDEAKAAAGANWNGRATRETHPAEWRRFLIYAGQDIEAMRAAHAKMPMWNYRGAELTLWHLDQRINDRGVAVDVELAECAINAVDEAQAELRERCNALTNGEVESATKRDAILLHVLAEYGVDLPDLQGATLERRIADPDLPEGLRELLRIRLAASTTSTSKYRTLIKGTSSDGRLRGLLQFCGAGRTGRWAGRLWQPQNLPSRGLLPQDQIVMGIEALKSGTAGILFDDVMKLTSSTIRGCIVAPPNKKLVIADLSNIEGRVAAWLAGERWKLKAFQDFDTGTGHDLYILAYAKAFGVNPADVSKAQRQIGKVMELALQFEGGVGAFTTMASGYGFDLEAMAEAAYKGIPGAIWGQANVMLEWHRKQKRDPAHMLGLSDRAWLVCESFVLGWREGHANIKGYWKELDTAVRCAITTPGQTFPCGYLKVRRDGAWLRIVLPSGRAICYPSPALVPEKKARKNLDAVDTDDVMEETGRSVITYMGMNQYTRKWERITSYSGKLYENCVQATARDVMAANMPMVEDEFYEIVLSVHDELITEAPDNDDWNPEHLAAIMATVPEWAPGLPLAAAGFEAYRYRKD